MWQLAAALIEIALRRRGPDALPDSSFLVFFLLAVEILATLAAIVVNGGVTGTILILLAADTALFFSFVFAVLSFFRLERRYRQTVSAMLGANIVVLIVYLPVALGALALGVDLNETPMLVVRYVLYYWGVFIGGSVLARSLSQPLIVGLMFEMLYVLTYEGIADFVSPPQDVAITENA